MIGRLIADKYGRGFPGKARLGFASSVEFSTDDPHVYQGPALIADSTLRDLSFFPLDLNDAKWLHGTERGGTALALPLDLGIDVARYIGKIVYSNDTTRRALLFVEPNTSFIKAVLTGPPLDPLKSGFPNRITISGAPLSGSDIALFPYVSQYGLQGTVYSLLYNHLGISVGGLRLLCAALFAVTFTTLTLLYASAIGKGFAACFFVSAVLSPWVIAFSNNLYWSSFLWFLPALFSTLFFLYDTRRHRYALTIAIFTSFLTKFLCGYEYTSTIISLAASAFAVDLFSQRPRHSRADSIRGLLLVSLLGVASFMLALLLHAQMRADTIGAGLKIIFESDAKRHGLSLQHLSVSPWDVVWKYVLNWKTDFIAPISGKLFGPIVILSAVLLIFRFISAHPTRYRDLGLWIVFLGGPLSWFILAKVHSLAHQHMNYVLWYFGFSAACLFIICGSALDLIAAVRRRLNRAGSNGLPPGSRCGTS